MSNRTNQTLSANTNRLNLGSRTLALKATGIDMTSLRFRLAHLSHPGVVAREERMRFEPSINMPAYRPAKPDSKRGTCDLDGSKSTPLASSWLSPLSPSRRLTADVRAQGQVVAEAPPVLRPVVVSDIPASRLVPRPGQPNPQVPSRPAASARATGRPGLASRSARTSAALASAAAC